MAEFDVVGYDPQTGEPVTEGDVMGGDVMGAARAMRRSPARTMRIPARPPWRAQLAPGVIQPDEGMVVLPLQPQQGSPQGTFDSTVTSITFQGQLQKPYRPERLLVSVVRTGSTAVQRLLGQLWVGTDLQAAEIAGWDVELVGQATAFGTRLTCKAAEPGVLVRMVIGLSSPISASTDFIFASMMFLGRIIH